MSIFNRFSSRGTARGYGKNNSGLGMRVVNENRKPFYIVYILDKSGSMSGIVTVINEAGEAVKFSKISQVNEGLKKLIKTLQDFEDNNPLYRVYIQIIELDSYGKAVFPEFQPISRGFEEINFDADGCTELRASLSTLKTFINPKYLKDERAGREGKGYNKAVSVILMSDGWPTDVNGVEQSGPAYRGVIDEFKQYLRDMDYERNVDLYSMAVGDDACEDMLRYFCDGDEDLGDRSRFYRVEECESIANALDFMTRATLAHHTTIQVPIDDEDDEDDEDDGGETVFDSTATDTVDTTDTDSDDFSNAVVDDESDDDLSDLFDGLDE